MKATYKVILCCSCALFISFWRSNSYYIKSDDQLETIPSEMNKIIGLWQYPGRKVWIKINDDGSTLQCRIATDGTVSFSRGKFINKSQKITWESIWPDDFIQLEKDGISFLSVWGNNKFIAALSSLDSRCSKSGT